MKKQTLAALAVALMQSAAVAHPLSTKCVEPICSMAVAPFSGTAPFMANVRYTLTGIPAQSASIDWADGTIEQVPVNQRTGFMQHLYTVPGAYTANLSVYNNCGGFIVVVTIYVGE